MGRPLGTCFTALAALSIAAAIALLPVDLHAHSGLETPASCSTCAVKSHSPGVLAEAASATAPTRTETSVRTDRASEPEPVTVAPSRSRAPPAT